jgi:hypothetical protein
MDSTILAYYRLCACFPNPHHASDEVVAELFKDKGSLYVSDGVVHASFVGGGMQPDYPAVSGGAVLVFTA